MQSTRTSKDNTSLETRPADHYHRFDDYKTLILSIMVLARPTYPPLPPPFFARVHNAQRTHTRKHKRLPYNLATRGPRGVLVWQWPCRRPASRESNLRLVTTPCVQEETRLLSPHYKQNRSYRL